MNIAYFMTENHFQEDRFELTKEEYLIDPKHYDNIIFYHWKRYLERTNFKKMFYEVMEENLM